MANSIINLLNWENRLDLQYVDSQIRSCEVTNNSPLNKITIKLHKGVDNTVRFRILNGDRKRVSVDHLAIRARLVDTQTKERVLERWADLVPNSKGDVVLTVYEGDLISIAPGFYSLVVTGQEALVPGETTSDNVNTPFYLDQGGNIVATVEVVDSADVTTKRNNESSAIAGARVKNHLNAVHSFSAKTTAFTGTLELFGSLDLQPPSDITNYFPIDITSGSQTITFDDYTGITSHTFEANFMWIKFVYKTGNVTDDSVDYGTIDKVLFR